MISAPDAGRLDAALPRARVHDQRRQLPERDDAPRARDPARACRRSSSRTSTTSSRCGRRAAAATSRRRCSRRRPTGPHEWEILTRLGGAAARACRNDDIDVDADRRRLLRRARARRKGVDAADGAWPQYDRRRARAHARPADPHRPVRRPLRRGARRPHARSSSEDAAARHRPRPDGPARARAARARRRARSSSRPTYITDDVAAAARRGSTASATAGCVLVSRRHLRSNNSWMHNVKVLVKGKDRCTLLIHPDDAARVGVRRRRARAASARRPARSRCRSR